MRDIRLWSLFALLIALTPPALSHQVGGDSYLHLQVDSESMQGQWGIALFSFGNVLALDGDRDGKITHDEARARLGLMADYALARLTLSMASGACTLQPGEHEVVGRHVIVRFTVRCPLPQAAIGIDYRLFFEVDPLHRGLLRLDYQDRTHTGIFTTQRPTLRIDLVDERPWRQFLEYVVEGIWHIWIGFDHVLFLVVLLLPAVLRRQGQQWEPVATLHEALLSVLKIVTTFTVAHSLTLGVAVLGIVTPPARLVESIIALSVVVAALNNLYPVIPVPRLLALTFGFGLIHGFGFASVLQDLGLPRGALVRSLLGFNVGVEIGQMAIVGIALPFIYAVRRQWLYPRVVLGASSAAIAGIATLWFVERAFELRPLLPSAPDVDPRAALTQVLPYLLPQLAHPLVIVGGVLLVLMGILWVFGRVGSVGPTATRAVRYSLVGALGMLLLGIALACSAAWQEASLMARATEIGVELAEPLRRQLKVAESRDMAYQEQLAALQAATTFLATQQRQRTTADQIAQALEQLAVGRTGMAQTLLRQHADAAAAQGDLRTAATAERHRGAVALLEDIQTALDAYRRALDLDPQDWHGWLSSAYVFERTGQYPEAEAGVRRALELTQAANDPSRIGKTLEHLGALRQAKGIAEEAEAPYREALDIYRVLGDESGMARVYTQVGTLYAQLRRFDTAQTMYRDALSIHQRLGDKTGLAVDYAHLGAVYVARGLFEHAEGLYREALKLNEALDRRPGLALVYADLGHLAQRRGDAQQAEQMYRQALAVDEALRYQPGMASHYSHLGLLSRQAGNLEQAIMLLRQALSIDATLGNHLGLAINTAHLAGIYQTQGDLAQAEDLYQQALALNDRLGRPAGRAVNYAHLGHLYRQRGDRERAEGMYRHSLALFSEAGIPTGAAQVQSWLEALNTAP